MSYERDTDRLDGDEFDHLPPDAPQGVHRKPAQAWRTVAPFLVALVVAPLLAWGATLAFTREHKPPVMPTPDVTAQSQPQSAPEPKEPVEEEGPVGVPDEIEDEQQATPEPEPEPQLDPVDYAASISVLNASGIAGLAGSDADALIAAGFAHATAGNSSDAVTPQNTVYYRDASMRSTAQMVGEILGIHEIVEDAGAVGSDGVVVLLRSGH